MNTSSPRTTDRTSLKSWLAPLRVRTLPLALAGSVVAAGLAGWNGSFSWPIFLLMLITAGLLQTLSDYANDYGDFQKGTDSEHRKGPRRAMQSGVMTPAQMKIALVVISAAAFVSGVALIIVSLGFDNLLPALAFVLIGVAALGAAIKYTMGSGAYGYRALGDLAVFLFFGIASVAGGFYLYAQALPWPVLLPAIGIGGLSTGVLNLNNMRDIENDRASNKITVAVLLGPKRSVYYHYLLVVGGSLGFVAFSLVTGVSATRIVYLLGLILVGAHLVRVSTASDDSAAIDRELKPLSISALVVALLFSAAIAL